MKAKREVQSVPCYYGCGRPAAGSLHVSFTSFSGFSYKEGFSASIPSCRECLRGALKVTVRLPEKGAAR